MMMNNRFLGKPESVVLDWLKLPDFNVNVQFDAERGTVKYPTSAKQRMRIQLDAIPKEGFKFKQWSDGNTNSNHFITVTGNINLSAEFEEIIPADILKFTALEANSSVGMDKVGSPIDVSLQYKVNDEYSWHEFVPGTTSVVLDANDCMLLRATNNNTTFSLASDSYYVFVMSGKIACSGSIQYLLSKDGSRNDAPTHCYYKLFAECSSLAAAPDLPATKLSSNCYYYMFLRCIELTSMPYLPATKLVTSCYTGMFQNCKKLLASTKLPSTELDSPSCYRYMFNGCSALSSVTVKFKTWNGNVTQNWLASVKSNGTFNCPAELPIERGPDRIPAAWEPFQLILQVPEHGRIEGAVSGQRFMRNDTITLTAIADEDYEFESWSDGNTNAERTLTFTSDIDLSATFKKTNTILTFTAQGEDSSITLNKVGSPDQVSLEYYDGTWHEYDYETNPKIDIPAGSSIQMRAKDENETFSKDDSNYYQFSMTGKIAASGSIQYLLKKDGSRTDVPSSCFYNMFRNCTSLISASELPATILADSCFNYMFRNCTSLTSAPKKLPATILAEYCYYNMFYNCTSLTSAPELQATSLAYSCYSGMFSGCAKVNDIYIPNLTVSEYNTEKSAKNSGNLGREDQAIFHFKED